MDVIWAKREGIYFWQEDWTGSISLIGFDKFAVWRKARRSRVGGTLCCIIRLDRTIQHPETLMLSGHMPPRACTTHPLRFQGGQAHALRERTPVFSFDGAEGGLVYG